MGHEGGWFNAVLALLHSLKLRLLFCSRKNSLGLIVALDYKREAKGELYWDDGASAGRLPLAPTAVLGQPLQAAQCGAHPVITDADFCSLESIYSEV